MKCLKCGKELTKEEEANKGFWYEELCSKCTDEELAKSIAERRWSK